MQILLLGLGPTWSRQASLSSAASVAAEESDKGHSRIWNFPQWLFSTWICDRRTFSEFFYGMKFDLLS